MAWFRGWMLVGMLLIAIACTPVPDAPVPTPTKTSAALSIPLVVGAELSPTPVQLTTSPISATSPEPTPAAPSLPYRVLASYPHDTSAWTQGLIVAGPGRLYEGTGDYANSSLREVELASGRIVRSVDLGDPALYGEGITQVGDTIVQLTWQNRRGLIYDVATFNRIATFTYPTPPATMPVEGWGLTYDGTYLIMSDGTATLYFIDPTATRTSGQLTVVRTLTVLHGDRPLDRLNELEYINGVIFANVWYSDQIALIDPANGQVIGWLNMSGLLSPPERAAADVLNGIAYDPENGQIFITGKRWPRLFAIALEQSLYLPLISAPDGR